VLQSREIILENEIIFFLLHSISCVICSNRLSTGTLLFDFVLVEFLKLLNKPQKGKITSYTFQHSTGEIIR